MEIVSMEDMVYFLEAYCQKNLIIYGLPLLSGGHLRYKKLAKEQKPSSSATFAKFDSVILSDDKYLFQKPDRPI